MSGHEEHHEHHAQQAPVQAVADDKIIGSSVVLPVAHSNILDYIYLSGISLLPVYGGSGGGVGGVGGGGGADVDPAVGGLIKYRLATTARAHRHVAAAALALHMLASGLCGQTSSIRAFLPNIA